MILGGRQARRAVALVLSLLVDIFEYFVCVTHAFLYFAFDLLRGSLCLLRPASGDLTNFSLHFAGDILDFAFDLIPVHVTPPLCKNSP
jgi:hypothetical protein